jgi:hypothetical protein
MSKELAVQIAELLGNRIELLNGKPINIHLDCNNVINLNKPELVDYYLDQSAWRILKMEDMTLKIDEYLWSQSLKTDFNVSGIKSIEYCWKWWRTLNPIKICELFVQMESE